MDRIIDYVRWYADLPFDIVPFNEVDNLVFCGLSYWKFPDMDWKRNKKHTLRECFESLHGEPVQMMTTEKDETMPDFVRYAAESKRFGDLYVSNYVDEFYPEIPIQFSAITFHLDRFTRYIAFRGTDSSIAGWKEDFMISFTQTKAQERSLEYLDKHIRPGRSYYVGGHSKGANDINPISTTIRPEFCVIGKIFEPKIDDCRIVKSTQKAGMQHSIFSWGIDAGDLALADAYDPQSVSMGVVFDRWMENVSPEERKTFTEGIFGALEEDGSLTLSDVLEKWPASIENVIVSVLDGDQATKDTLKKLPEAAIQEELKAANKVTKKVKKEIAHQPYLLDAAIGLIGLLLLLLPIRVFDIFLAILLFLVFAAETTFTVRRLMKNHWNMQAERMRIMLCIVLLVIFLLILVKDQALFVLSSALFGGILLFYAYFTASKLKEDRKFGPFFWFHLIEAIVFSICGLFILVAPQWIIRWYSIVVGSILIVDAAIHAIIQLLKIKNEK